MPIYRIPGRSFGPQGDEPRPINWRRGMYRIWLLFSAAWMMSWIIYLIMSGLQEGFKTPGDLLAVPVVLFGPPFALLAFGIAAGWAFRGFADDSQPGK